MGKLRVSKKGLRKTLHIKKTVGFKLCGTSFRVGAKGVSTSTKICKGVRYTTFIPYENKKTNKETTKNSNNKNIKKIKKEKIKQARKEIKENKQAKQLQLKNKYSYDEFYKMVTHRIYTDNEKMNLILKIGESGLPVEQRVMLISLIKTK